MFNTQTWIGIIGLMFIAVMLIALKPGDEKAQELPDDEGEAFAVVELFTSEGCSSCPPADKVLNDIVEKAQESGKRIYPLAFHVDYWNRLGWKDEFSSAAYSQRQRSYARALGSGVYTPQMIINGKNQFVGSNSAKARNGIQNSLDRAAGAEVSLGDIKMSAGNTVLVDYEVSGNYAQTVLNLAIVERGIVTDVKRGENRGRTLRHENVVRGFRSVDLSDATGSASLQVPDEVDMSEASVIAYVQNPDTKEIYGAQGMDLKKKISESN